MKDTDSPLLSRREAAAYLGLEPGTLTNWASTRRYTLPFVKVGRLVKYRKADLDEFIRLRLVTPTETEIQKKSSSAR